MTEWERMTIANAKQITELIASQRQFQKDLSDLSKLIKEQELTSVNRRLRSLEYKLDLLNPIVVMCKYPKITTLIIVLVSSLYISDIRHPLFKFIGLM